MDLYGPAAPSADARCQAAQLLPTRSLEPVVLAVARCLHFYLT